MRCPSSVSIIEKYLTIKPKTLKKRCLCLSKCLSLLSGLNIRGLRSTRKISRDFLSFLSLKFYHISAFFKNLANLIRQSCAPLAHDCPPQTHGERISLPVIAFRLITFSQELQQGWQKNKGADQHKTQAECEEHSHARDSPVGREGKAARADDGRERAEHHCPGRTGL